jgi:hypothetical protein
MALRDSNGFENIDCARPRWLSLQCAFITVTCRVMGSKIDEEKHQGSLFTKTTRHVWHSHRKSPLMIGCATKHIGRCRFSNMGRWRSNPGNRPDRTHT